MASVFYVLFRPPSGQRLVRLPGSVKSLDEAAALVTAGADEEGDSYEEYQVGCDDGLRGTNFLVLEVAQAREVSADLFFDELDARRAARGSAGKA